MLECLQLLIFAVPDPFMMDVGATQGLRYLSVTLEAVLMHRLIGGDGVVISIVAIAILTTCAALVAYVGYGWVEQNLRFNWAIGALRMISALVIGVLYIPLVMALVGMMNCMDASTMCTVNKIGAVSFMALLFPFAIAYSGTVYRFASSFSIPIPIPIPIPIDFRLPLSVLPIVPRHHRQDPIVAWPSSTKVSQQLWHSLAPSSRTQTRTPSPSHKDGLCSCWPVLPCYSVLIPGCNLSMIVV